MKPAKPTPEPSGEEEAPTSGASEDTVAQGTAHPAGHVQTVTESPRLPSGTPGRRVALAHTFAPGDKIADRYQVVRFLAAGGMGEVYVAQDVALRAEVALKTIRSDIAENAKALERFKREILLARKVTHPNACRIFDLGYHRMAADEGGGVEEIAFLTMELLPGESLSQRLNRGGKMSPAEALPLVAQMASALQAAHDAGIVHRDFKSANVILVPDAGKGPRAVVTDFGLARGSGEGTSISDTGAVVGTPAYMSPEQVEGQPATPASDLYSLGVVMYEMVTGQRPFTGDSAISVAMKRLKVAPPSPRLHVADLDPVWEATILRCLERDPARRFPRVDDVVRALRGEAVTPPPDERATSRFPPRMLAAGALVLAALAVVVALWRRPTTPPPAPVATTSAPVALRRSVAVLGFQNTSGSAANQWLAPAISEILATALGAGERLRVIPAQDVARMQIELGVKDPRALDRDGLAKVRRNLGVDLIVSGAFTVLGGPDSRLIRLDVELRDAATGEQLVAVPANGTDRQILDVTARAAAVLRKQFGLGELTPGQSVELMASYPSKPEAARLFVEGLDKLRRFDALGAQIALEKAATLEARHPLIHSSLAAALSLLGYDSRARDHAHQAVELATGLPEGQRLAIEAQLHELAKDWDKAIAAYRALVAGHPDDLDTGLSLASALTAAGKPRDALVAAGALRQLPLPLADDPRVDLVEGRAYQEIGEYGKQRGLAASAARKAQAQGQTLLLARARGLEAVALDLSGEKEKAMVVAEQARGLFATAGDRSSATRAMEEMATILGDGQGDFEGARRLYEKALAIDRELGDQRAVARVLHNLGSVSLAQGRLEAAKKFYDEALATFRAIGAKYEAAYTLNDLGARLYLRGDLPGAQKSYEEAMALFGEVGEKAGLAMSLTNLGEVLFSRGSLDQAQSMHEESLATNREIGAKGGMAYDLFRLGLVASAKGDLTVAAQKYDQALKIQNEVGDSAAAAGTKLALARLALDLDKPKDAEASAREAEEAFRAQKAKESEALALAVQALALQGQGKRAPATEALARALTVTSKSEDRALRLEVDLIAARVRALAGAPAEQDAVFKTLEATESEAKKAGLVGLQLQAALTRGQLEMACGRAAVGRTRLRSVETEARSKGFGLIARQAATSASS